MTGRTLLATAATVGKLAGAAALAGVLVAAMALPAIGGMGLTARNSANHFQNLPQELEQPPLPQRSKILAADGSTLATFYYQNRIAVPLDKIAPVMRDALIAIEDSRYFQHNGVDMQGIARALAVNLRSGEVTQGGSTLTQQYVENVLLLKADSEQEKRGARGQTVGGKLREVRYALETEERLSKQQVLQRYLNIAYFGDGAYGVEAAARHYFNTSADQLTLSEAALIAGLVKAPGAYNPVDNPEAAKQRRDTVINTMADTGQISTDRARKAKASALGLDVQEMHNGCVNSSAPFFCLYVIEEIRNSEAFGENRKDRISMLRRGGLTIHTTLNPDAQQATKNALQERVPPGDSSNKAASEAMVEPGTGKIRALTSSLGFGQGENETMVNLAADRAHGGSNGAQAGSTFKAFTLAAALSDRLPFSHSIHAPYELNPGTFENCDGQSFQRSGWTPNNFSRSQNGRYTLEEATKNSVNTYFVQLENEVGLCNVVQTARSTGLTRANGKQLRDGIASFTLGTANVAPVDMASAFATFAARGKRCDPIAITKVLDRNDEQIEVPDANCKRVMPQGVADGVNYLLQGVLQDGTAEGNGIGRPAAGKTGTTNSNRAAWFVGYTPDLASAVWVGDPRGGQAHPLRNVTIGGRHYGTVAGSTLPAPIWQQSMQGALEGTSPTGFQRPPGWMFQTPDDDGSDDSGGSDGSGDDESGNNGNGNGNGPPGGGNGPPGGEPPGGGPPGNSGGNGNGNGDGGNAGGPIVDPPPGGDRDRP